MNSITSELARDLLLGCDARLVAQEQPRCNYDNFSGLTELNAYTTNDCLVIHTDVYWHIHALSKHADIISAIDEVKAVSSAEEMIFILTWNTVPEELKDNIGSYKYSREYQPYEDLQIRKLTENDCEAVSACCAPDPDDNDIGKDISDDLLSDFKDYCTDSSVSYLGLFNGNELLGIAQGINEKALNLTTINIFVNRQYRKMGYAKRLVSAICAISSDTVYCYSCVKRNAASIATAKSCGFVFKGAYLLIR